MPIRAISRLVEEADRRGRRQAAGERERHADVMGAPQHEGEAGQVDRAAQREIDGAQRERERHAERGDREQREIVEQHVG